MKRLVVAAATLAIVLQCGTTLLEACGAKFLVATGSAFLQRLQRTRQPANILIYQHTRDSDVVEFVTKLRAMLRDMGHQVTVADGEAALRDSAGGKFTVVMLKLDEARRLKVNIASALPNAAILPMDALVTQPVIAVARQEFGRMLVLPATTKEVFSTVEAANR
jgi:CheY-like chemotaxis protein